MFSPFHKYLLYLVVDKLLMNNFWLSTSLSKSGYQTQYPFEIVRTTLVSEIFGIEGLTIKDITPEMWKEYHTKKAWQNQQQLKQLQKMAIQLVVY